MFKNQYNFKIFSFPLFLIILIFILVSTGILIDKGHARGKCTVAVKTLSKLDTRKGNRASADALNKQGLGRHNSMDYCEAINLWTEAAKVDPSWWKPFFNIACAAALSGDTVTSFKFIGLAMARDHRRVINSLKNDSDLKSLREIKFYRNLVSGYHNTLGAFSCEDKSAVVVYRYDVGYIDSKGKKYYLAVGPDPIFKGTEKLKYYYFIPGKTYRICYRWFDGGGTVGADQFVTDAQLIK